MINIILANWNGWAYAFAWSIVDSLWQFLLIGILLKLILWLFSHQSSDWRYHISTGALLLCVGLWFTNMAGYLLAYQVNSKTVAVAIENNTTTNNKKTAFEHSNVNHLARQTPIDQKRQTNLTKKDNLKIAATEWVSKHKTILTFGWLMGVLILFAKMLGSWWYLRTLRSSKISVLSEQQLLQFRQLQKQLKINAKVQFYLSQLVSEPITFGFLKPIILLPIGLINQLTDSEVEAILLHELAHIKRNDFMVNMLQNCIEITLFYHPVIWWISGQIRDIREECCDDMAVAALQNKTTYASALVQVQRYSLTFKINLVMTATGKKGQLTKRVHRLFAANTDKKRTVFSFPLMVIFLFVGSLSLLAFQVARQHQPTVSVAADKMNILYMGVENPLTVALEGISNDKVTLTSSDLDLQPNGNGQYLASAKKIGKATITVATDNLSRAIVFEVLPLPTPKGIGNGNLSQGEGGITKWVTPKEMHELKGIKAETFAQFDVTCEIVSYEFTRVPKDGDPVTERGSKPQGIFNNRMKIHAEQAKAGDVYYVDSLMAKCPGDSEPRMLESLIFRVKSF